MTHPSGPLCRDCLNHLQRMAPRCLRCGSPRLLAHPDRDSLVIAHVDCDAFFAGVEKRDDPRLRDRPVIVGGGRRGVVATACYIARTYGVHSAMPMFKALELCPEAVVIAPAMEKYRAAGRAIRQMMTDLTPLVEAVSIDEAFLDLSGTERLHQGSPATTLARFARRVENELGLSVSVGLSFNKFLAKVASDLHKPRGYSILGPADAAAFLADRPVQLIPGVGRSTRGRLAKAGVTLIRHLRETPAVELARILGREAHRVQQFAWGHDPRAVTPERPAKSLSAETTFEADLQSFAQLQPVLWRLAERLSARLKRAGMASRSVTLKLKDSEFRLTTRTRSGLAPTQIPARLFEPAQELLKAECDGRRFRLIGIASGDLCDGAAADRGDLADQQVLREAQREAAIDRIRQRFGEGALQRGIIFRLDQR